MLGTRSKRSKVNEMYSVSVSRSERRNAKIFWAHRRATMLLCHRRHRPPQMLIQHRPPPLAPNSNATKYSRRSIMVCLTFNCREAIIISSASFCFPFNWIRIGSGDWTSFIANSVGQWPTAPHRFQSTHRENMLNSLQTGFVQHIELFSTEIGHTIVHQVRQDYVTFGTKWHDFDFFSSVSASKRQRSKVKKASKFIWLIILVFSRCMMRYMTTQTMRMQLKLVSNGNVLYIGQSLRWPKLKLTDSIMFFHRWFRWRGLKQQQTLSKYCERREKIANEQRFNEFNGQWNYGNCRMQHSARNIDFILKYFHFPSRY